MLETVDRTAHHPLTPRRDDGGDVEIRCSCGQTVVGEDLTDAADAHAAHAAGDDSLPDRNG